MKNRISRVTTRTGDRGMTGLADGSRLSKSASIVEAIGAVDELNTAIGVLIAEVSSLKNSPQVGELAAELQDIQHSLFEIGAELALPGNMKLSEDDVLEIEALSKLYNAKLEPLEEFILPGTGRVAAWCHYCRAIARRAERNIVEVELSGEFEINPHTLAWVNRLSDYLFIIARILNYATGNAETYWKPRRQE